VVRAVNLAGEVRTPQIGFSLSPQVEILSRREIVRPDKFGLLFAVLALREVCYTFKLSIEVRVCLFSLWGFPPNVEAIVL
jgi:hypothetical protein